MRRGRFAGGVLGSAGARKSPCARPGQSPGHCPCDGSCCLALLAGCDFNRTDSGHSEQLTGCRCPHNAPLEPAKRVNHATRQLFYSGSIACSGVAGTGPGKSLLLPCSGGCGDPPCPASSSACPGRGGSGGLCASVFPPGLRRAGTGLASQIRLLWLRDAACPVLPAPGRPGPPWGQKTKTHGRIGSGLGTGHGH